MDKTVARSEILYRAVKRSQPNTIDEHGKPTPALFKDDNGVSVDRDGGRFEPEIIDCFKNRFGPRFKALFCFGADICLDNNMAVIPDHDYHAEIFDDFQKTPLSSLKALILADSCKAVTFESNIAWVSPIKKV